jgi:hypothetical protein
MVNFAKVGVPLIYLIMPCINIFFFCHWRIVAVMNAPFKDFLENGTSDVGQWDSLGEVTRRDL